MFKKIALKGELGLAESYMDGDWNAYDLEGVLYELKKKYELFVSKIKKQSRGIFLWQIVYTKNPSNRKDDCHHLRNYF